MTDDDIRHARRLCLFAHYHPRGIAAEYVLHYLAELKRSGFTTVVISTATLDHGERAKLEAACDRLIERENIGLDFGGWIEAFRHFSPLQAELLLLANDSVYGPLTPLSDFVDRLTSVPADVYGAVESREGGTHLQSWFLLLRPAAYRSAAFAEAMRAPIPADMSKREIIARYETAIVERLRAEGLSVHAAYSSRSGGDIVRGANVNASHVLWDVLVARYGIPFIKVELLRDNPFMVGGTARWRRLVAARCPALVPMIAADLAARGARTPAGLRERIGWSLGAERRMYRPELRPFLARDALPRSRLARRIDARLYAIVARWGDAARAWFVRRLERR